MYIYLCICWLPTSDYNAGWHWCTKSVSTCVVIGTTGRKEDCFAANSYYMRVYMYCIIFHMRVLTFTRMYTCGLMSHVVFAFAQACHTRGLFKLWVICTICMYVVITGQTKQAFITNLYMSLCNYIHVLTH